MLYVHTQTKNSSNVPFDTDFIRSKITDKKVPKRTAIQETVLDAVRSYNEVIEIAGKSTVRTVYAPVSYTHLDVYKRQPLFQISSLRQILSNRFSFSRSP